MGLKSKKYISIGTRPFGKPKAKSRELTLQVTTSYHSGESLFLIETIEIHIRN